MPYCTQASANPLKSDDADASYQQTKITGPLQPRPDQTGLISDNHHWLTNPDMTTDCSNRYPRITITYCTRCNWLLRAAWLAQELLQTFSDQLGEVALQPGDGGVFQIFVEVSNGQPVQLWSRTEDDGFPEAKILKRRLRDQIDPDRDLGHNDR